MYPSKDFAQRYILTSLIRVAPKVAVAAVAAIGCLGGVQALWMIGTNREMAAATELRHLGGTVLWAWRLDDMMQKKQTASSQSPRWLIPGDSIVTSVYLTNCGEPRLDEKLVNLEPLRNLRYLAVAGTNVTDAALIHVAKLSDLEWLDLGSTLVTDDGLRNLTTLKRLKYVNLSGTGITRKGVADLRAQFPAAKIVSDFDEMPSASLQLGTASRSESLRVSNTLRCLRAMLLPGVWFCID
jgi:hypothetical protein